MKILLRVLLIILTLVFIYFAWRDYSARNSQGDTANYGGQGDSDSMITRRLAKIPTDILKKIAEDKWLGKKYKVLPYRANYTGHQYFDGQIHQAQMSYDLTQKHCEWTEKLKTNFFGSMDREPHRIVATSIYTEMADASSAIVDTDFEIGVKQWVSTITEKIDIPRHSEHAEKYQIDGIDGGFVITHSKPTIKRETISGDSALLFIESLQLRLDMLKKEKKKYTYQVVTFGPVLNKISLSITPVEAKRYPMPDEIDLFVISEHTSSRIKGKWEPNNNLSIRIVDSHGILLYEEYESEFIGKAEMIIDSLALPGRAMCKSN